jgi:hypothetical protein
MYCKLKVIHPREWDDRDYRFSLHGAGFHIGSLV